MTGRMNGEMEEDSDEAQEQGRSPPLLRVAPLSQ